MTILDTLRQADAQPGDWYGWLTNQAAHMALVGIPVTLALVAVGVPLWLAPIIAAAVYAVVWEWLIQRSKDVADSLTDTAMTMAGAMFVAAILHDFWTAVLTFALYAALSVAGVARRL